MKRRYLLALPVCLFCWILPGSRTWAETASKEMPETTIQAQQAFPRVRSIRVNHKTAGPGTTVELHFRLPDSEQWEFAQAYYRPPVPSYQKGVKLRYSKAMGEWTGKLKIRRGFQNGLYRLSEIRVFTKEGGYVEIYNSKANAATGRYLWKRQSQNLNGGNFRVKGSKADFEAPNFELESLNVQKRKKGNRIVANYSIRCTDAGRIKNVEMVLGSQMGDKKWLYLKYHKKTGKFHAKAEFLQLPNYRQDGSWWIESIQAEDEYGNIRICNGLQEKGGKDLSRGDLQIP